MPKIKDRYILFSGNVQGTNDGDLPSIYLSPSNFTPAQVASEGNDKVSAYLNGINTSLGQLLKLDGTRTMTGSLNMGTFNITNVGTINSVTVETHASRHLPNGADPLTTAAAITLTPDLTNATGDANSMARSNHVHNVPTAIAVTLNADSINSQGNAESFARSNHTHEITKGTAVTLTPDLANAEGDSVGFARANHVHNVPTASAITISTSSVNSQGNAASFARSNHTHKVEISREHTKSNATTSTTSTANTSLLSITPPAGTYILLADASSTHNTNNGQAIYSIYVGGTQQANTEAASTRGSQKCPLPYSISMEVTVDGTQAVALYWRTNTGTLTNVIRSLTLIKVA